MRLQSPSPDIDDDADRDRLLVREVDGEMLILDTTADRVHRLNQTASLIWRLWDQGVPIDKIESEVASRFDVDAETVHIDVQLALETFRSQSLVREQSG